jgi:hypothetical protein
VLSRRATTTTTRAVPAVCVRRRRQVLPLNNKPLASTVDSNLLKFRRGRRMLKALLLAVMLGLVPGHRPDVDAPATAGEDGIPWVLGSRRAALQLLDRDGDGEVPRRAVGRNERRPPPLPCPQAAPPFPTSRTRALSVQSSLSRAWGVMGIACWRGGGHQTRRRSGVGPREDEGGARDAQRERRGGVKREWKGEGERERREGLSASGGRG